MGYCKDLDAIFPKLPLRQRISEDVRSCLPIDRRSSPGTSALPSGITGGRKRSFEGSLPTPRSATLPERIPTSCRLALLVARVVTPAAGRKTTTTGKKCYPRRQNQT